MMPMPLGPPFGPSAYDPQQVQAKIRSLTLQSFFFGVPGMILQAVANPRLVGELGGPLCSLVGAGLVVLGLSRYALSRGRSAWFGLFGLLSCVGIIILALLPKKCIVCAGPVAAARCTVCGAPGA